MSYSFVVSVRLIHFRVAILKIKKLLLTIIKIDFWDTGNLAHVRLDMQFNLDRNEREYVMILKDLICCRNEDRAMRSGILFYFLFDAFLDRASTLKC